MRKLWPGICVSGCWAMSICGQSLVLTAVRAGLQRLRRAALAATHSNSPATPKRSLQSAHDVVVLRGVHGGPRQTANSDEPGAGKTRNPARLPTTLSLPTLQHGHNPASSLATRAKNAWADSVACGLDAIVNAINDALRPLKAQVWSQTVTPEKILKALGHI